MTVPDAGSGLHLTIHRGAREIGGTCVELAAGPSRIVVDLGIPLVGPDGSPFDMRDHASLDGPGLVAAGVLPDVAGLYAWQQPSVDGVLVSHAHLDHYGFLSHVHPRIPVHLGEATRKLVAITSDFTGREPPGNRFVTFRWPSRFAIGAFTVTPHLVDHSAFEAFAFEIEAGGRRVVYSGDFRRHGHVAKATDIMLRTVAPGADALLLEGTMFGREDDRVMTEAELAAAATELCRDTRGVVLVYQSGQNVSRVVSFYKAAKAAGRLFVPDIYMAHVLAELGAGDGGSRLPVPGRPGFEDVRVWFPWRVTNRLFQHNRQEIPFAHCQHKITRDEMADDLGRVMLFVRPGMEGDLARFDGLAGGLLIYSLWAGYAEQPRTRRFLEQVAAMGVRIEHLHTSGHADITTLAAMVDALRPVRVIPVHTFYPEKYAPLFGSSVQWTNDGQAIAI